MRGREALVIGLATAALIAAPSAHAACDEPVASARATTHPDGQLAPLAIGDSTMVWSVPFLARRGFDANARACRSWTEGLAMMRKLKSRHRLPSVVVLALGANSTVRAIDVRRALKLIGPKRRLGLPTHRTWFGKPGADTGVIRRMARRYPNRIRLIDWVRYARPHPDWFDNHGYDDGLHTNRLGARKFAAFIQRCVAQK